MSENINQIEPPPDSLSLVEINANINNFLKQTQSQFELLKEFLQREQRAISEGTQMIFPLPKIEIVK